MKCKECHGSGESAYPPYSETDPYGDLVNCRSCNGTGIAYPKHIWLEQATALISDESGHHWVDYKQPDGHKIEYVRADLYAELEAQIKMLQKYKQQYKRLSDYRWRQIKAARKIASYPPVDKAILKALEKGDGT